MIITLLSDMGLLSGQLSALRDALLRQFPDANLIDVSVEVEKSNIRQAAYLWAAAHRYFPPGTIHIAAVHVFNGFDPQLVAARHNNSYFLAPDNGLIPLTLTKEPDELRSCATFSRSYTFDVWQTQVLKAVATIHSGNFASLDACYFQSLPVQRQPKIMADGLVCSVLHIDRFGNVVIDITRTQFETLINGRPFQVRISRKKSVSQISKNYHDVPLQEALCRFNLSGYLEIALNHNSAAALLGLNAMSAATLAYHSVNIMF